MDSIIAEVYDDVTMIFADLQGFDIKSTQMESRQVIELLSKLFTEFDKECNRLGLYKLYTVGDLYVAISFIDKTKRKAPEEEANDVVQLAICMLHTVRTARKQMGIPNLNLCIGIHTVDLT